MSTSTAHAVRQQARFAKLLPTVERHARVHFRHVRGQELDERVQETRAIAWKHFLRLEERGKNVFEFPTVFARRCAQAVQNGRRAAGMDSATDALSPWAQRKHGFKTEALPSLSTRSQHELYGDVRGQQQLDTWEERLHGTDSPVDEAVAFRLDFAQWLTTRTDRDRRIIADMVNDHGTGAIARRIGTTPGRVSQLRREYQQDWTRFVDE
jgi:hypothetical protein